MSTVQGQIDGLMEELIMLCEVRGELGPEGNAITEERIATVEREIAFLKHIDQRDRDQAVIDFSCEI